MSLHRGSSIHRSSLASYSNAEQLYPFGIHHTELLVNDDDHSISFLNKARLAQRKTSNRITDIIENLPVIRPSNLTLSHFRTSKIKKQALNQTILHHTLPFSQSPMRNTLNMTFKKKENRVEINRKEGSKLKTLKLSEHSISSKISRGNQSYLFKQTIGNQTLRKALNSSTPDPPFVTQLTDAMLKRLQTLTGKWHPILLHKNITKIQEKTKFTRYQLYSLYSTYQALKMDSTVNKQLEWPLFRNSLAIILNVKVQFIDRVVQKILTELDPPQKSIQTFMDFLTLVKKIAEYNRRQKLIEFIDVLFDVNRNAATYEQFVNMFQQYKSLHEAIEHTEKVYAKLGKQKTEEITKSQLKDLCINDRTICQLLSKLIR